MLVLTRKQGEEIRIDGCISVKVLAVRGSQVRLGITCPSDVRVLRSELVERPVVKRPDFSAASRDLAATVPR